MGFSDAEDDQPSKNSNESSSLQNGIQNGAHSEFSTSSEATSSNGDISSTGDNTIPSKPKSSTTSSNNITEEQAEINLDISDDISNVNIENCDTTLVNNANELDGNNGIATNPLQNENENSQNSSDDFSSMNGHSVELVNGTSINSEENGQMTASHSAEAADAIEKSIHNLNQEIANTPEGLKNSAVVEKLRQVERYISHSSEALKALEEEGDLNKVGQYNTLVKCLKELKLSEEKLSSHLNRTVNSTSHDNSERTTSGSESIGVIGPTREEGMNVPLRERLARHENEAQQLSERLRESLARRQELVARYQATRERLNNLKKQRLGIVNEERQLLQSMGAPEDPYENPIPGVSTWSIEQLQSAIIDFQGLRDKLMNLHSVYVAKMRAIDESETEEREELQTKITRITSKKTQIVNALAQMADLLRIKREGTNGESLTSNLIPESSEDAVNDTETQTSQPVPIANGEVENPRVNNEEGDVGSPSEIITEEVGEQIPFQENNSDDEIILDNNPNLIAKQRHLKDLKQKLNDMKKLLLLSQRCAAEDNASSELFMSDSPAEEEQQMDDESREALAEAPLVGSTIVGVNGQVIHLSEVERRNPIVASNFNQLTEAKKRLAKMEEIMEQIAEAKNAGLPLSDVLSPENMAVLNKAREEEGVINTSYSQDGATGLDVSGDLSDSSNDQRAKNLEIPPNQFHMNSSANSLSNVQGDYESSPLWHQKRDQLSSVHLQLNKNSPKIHPVNEGKTDVEKGAIKKRTTELLGSGVTDPRVEEMLNLQNELMEKKNALECLMASMGKHSTSETFGNISDPNSDVQEDPSSSNSQRRSQHHSPQNGLSSFRSHALQNNFSVKRFPNQSSCNVQNCISDRSTTSKRSSDFSLREQSTSSFNSPQNNSHINRKQNLRQMYSLPNTENPTFLSHLPEKSIRQPRGNVDTRNNFHLDNGGAASNASMHPGPDQLIFPQLYPSTSYAKNRRRNPTGSDVGQDLFNSFSLNNLNVATHPDPSQTKLNFSPSQNIPTGTWETFQPVPPLPRLASSVGAGAKVQNSVSFALSQLNQLQETISSLYSDLRAAEASVRQDQPLSSTGYGHNTYHIPSASYPPHQPVPESPNMHNFTSFPTNVQGVNGNYSSTSNHISSALQQCFSQLQQHSTEIQSLSKQLQNLRRSRDSLSPPRPQHDSRRSSYEMRNNESSRRATLCGQRVIKNNQHRIPNSSSRSPHCNRNTLQSVGGAYSNPLYENLPVRKRAPAVVDRFLRRNNGNWYRCHETSGSEDVSLNEEDFMIDWQESFGIEPGFRNSITAVANVTSPASMSGGQEPTGILNNQVLPGTRANNYWDNFRSYSRQNPLSSSAKSNTLEQTSFSDSNTPARTQGPMNNSHQPHQLSSNAKRNEAFKVTFSSNSINKAGDKNSFSSQSQNKCRGRQEKIIAPLENENRASTEPSFSPQPFNNVSPIASSHKRDNRGAGGLRHTTNETGCFSIIPKLDLSSNSSRTFEELTLNPSISRSFDESINRLEGRTSGRFLLTPSETRSNKFHSSQLRSQTLPNPQASYGAVADNGLSDSSMNHDVIQEAESLMGKLSEQPAFLVQLFEHASRITSGTDQKVALELLRELSFHRDQQIDEEVADSKFQTLSSNISPLRSPHYQLKNKTSKKNKGFTPERSTSLSSSSDGSSSSEDEVHFKNKRDGLKKTSKSRKLSMSSKFLPTGATNPQDSFVFPPVHPENASLPNFFDFSPINEPSASPAKLGKDLHKENHHLFIEKRGEGDGGDSMNYRRSVPGGHRTNVGPNIIQASKKASHKTSTISPLKKKDEGNIKDSPTQARRERNVPSSKDSFSLFPIENQAISRNSDGRIAKGLEELVPSALAEAFACFQSLETSLDSEFTSPMIGMLHRAVMKQVFYQSSRLGLPFQYVFSVDSQLSDALRNFRGEKLYDVKQDIVSTIIRVLMREFESSIEELKKDDSAHAALSFSTVPKAREQTVVQSKTGAVYMKEGSGNRDIPPSVNEFSLFDSNTNNITFKENMNLVSSFEALTPWSPPINQSSKIIDNKENRFKETGAISKNVSSNDRGSRFSVRDCDRPRAILGQSSDEETGTISSGYYDQPSIFPEAWIEKSNVENPSNVSGNDSACANTSAEVSEEVHKQKKSSQMFMLPRKNLPVGTENSKQNHSMENDQTVHQFPGVWIDIPAVRSQPVDELAEADQPKDGLEPTARFLGHTREIGVIPSSLSADCTQKDQSRNASDISVPREEGLDEVPTRLPNYSPELASSTAHLPPNSTQTVDFSIDESNFSFVVMPGRGDISNPTDDDDLALI